MSLRFKYSITLGIVMASLFLAPVTYAVITNFPQPQPEGEAIPYTFFTATTTSATSTNDGTGRFLNITGAAKVMFYFTHGGTATTSTGTSIFKVQVTPDGSNWYDYSKLVTSTSSAVVATVPIVGATSTVIANLSDILTSAYYGARCVVTESANGIAGQAGDGEHTCTAYVEY